MDIIKVASGSRTAAVAGAIARAIRERGKVHVRAIGVGAVNQAVKAIAVARSYLGPEGIEVACIPSFVDIQVNDVERTAINLEVLRLGG